MTLSVSQRAKLQSARSSRIPRVTPRVSADVAPACVASVDASLSMGEIFDSIAEAIDSGFDAAYRFTMSAIRVLLIVSIAWAGVSAAMGIYVIFDDAAERASVASTVSMPAPIKQICDYDRERARPICD